MDCILLFCLSLNVTFLHFSGLQYVGNLFPFQHQSLCFKHSMNAGSSWGRIFTWLFTWPLKGPSASGKGLGTGQSWGWSWTWFPRYDPKTQTLPTVLPWIHATSTPDRTWFALLAPMAFHIFSSFCSPTLRTQYWTPLSVVSNRIAHPAVVHWGNDWSGSGWRCSCCIILFLYSVNFTVWEMNWSSRCLPRRHQAETNCHEFFPIPWWSLQGHLWWPGNAPAQPRFVAGKKTSVLLCCVCSLLRRWTIPSLSYLWVASSAAWPRPTVTPIIVLTPQTPCRCDEMGCAPYAHIAFWRSLGWSMMKYDEVSKCPKKGHGTVWNPWNPLQGLIMDALDVHAGYGSPLKCSSLSDHIWVLLLELLIPGRSLSHGMSISPDFPDFQATPRLFGQAGSDPPWQLHPRLHEALKEAQRGAP